MGRLRGPDGGPPNFYKENFEEEKETMFLKSKSILNQIQQKKETNTFSKKHFYLGLPPPDGFSRSPSGLPPPWEHQFNSGPHPPHQWGVQGPTRLRGPDGGPPNVYKEKFEEEKETPLFQIINRF